MFEKCLTRKLLFISVFIFHFSGLSILLNAETPAKPFASPKAELSSGMVVPPEILKGVDQFFSLLKADKVVAAYDSILSDTKVKDRASEVNDMKAKTTTLLLEFGKVTDYELLRVRKIGSRMFVLTYLSYSEAYPLRWNMTFYKPSTVWRLIDIRGEVSISDLGEEFGESSK